MRRHDHQHVGVRGLPGPMPRILALAAMILVTAVGTLRSGTAAAGAPVWKPLGPAPITNGGFAGRISALVCPATRPDTCYAGGADGGLWRTDDGGATWQVLTDRLPTTAVGAVALDPSDEEVIYLGSGEANFANHSRYGLGVFRSADGGRTWTHLGAEVFAGRAISRLIVHPTLRNRLYAAVVPAGGFPEMAGAKEHPGARGPLGLFVSDDSGRTWRQIRSGLPEQAVTDLAMDPADPETLVAGVGRIFGAPENGLYRTRDGGGSWQRLAGGLPAAGGGRVALAFAAGDPLRLYTMIAKAADATGGGASTLGVWRSDDGGETWRRISSANLQATYGWYLNVVGVNPRNRDEVLLGGFDLLRSVNGGNSWSNVTPPHVDLHAIAWDARGRLWVGDDGGVHRSEDGGSTWTARNDGLGVIQFYAGISAHPVTPGLVYAGLQDNGSVRRSADGSTWDSVLGGDGGWTQLDPRSPSRVFVEYQGAGNLYFADDGRWFNASGSGISGSDRTAFLPPYLIDPADSARMLYGTHRVYASVNGGRSWSAVSGDVTLGAGAIRAMAIAPSNPQRVYLATNDGIVAASIDGGRTFTRALTGMPGWPRVTRELTVDPADDRVAYLAVAAFGPQRILRTLDGGATWRPLSGKGLPAVPVNTVLPGGPRGQGPLWAGTDQGVYRSDDGGGVWHPVGGGLPGSPVVDLALVGNRLLAATMGRGLWQLDLE